MNRYPLWKYAIILVVLVISAIYALPNLFGEAPAVQVSPARATVKVDSATVTRVERALAEQSLTPDVIQLEGTSVRARFASTDDQLKARDAIDRAFNTTDVCLVMDTARMSAKHRDFYTRKKAREA